MTERGREAIHLYPLRDPPHGSQSTVLDLLAHLSLGAVLNDRGRTPSRHVGRHWLSPLLHDGNGRVGIDDGHRVHRRANCAGTSGWLDSPDAYHAAENQHVLRGQGPHGVHDRDLQHRRAGLGGCGVRSATRRRAVAHHAGPLDRWPHPVRAHWYRAGTSHLSRLTRSGPRWRDVTLRVTRRGLWSLS